MEKRIEVSPRKPGAVESHLLQQKDSTVSIKDAASIRVIAARGELAAMVREGDDLVLRFADGTSVRLDGYFNYPADSIPDVVFVEDGRQWRAELSDSTRHLSTDTSVEALTYSFAPVTTDADAAAVAGGMSGGLLAGLGALLVGGGVAAAAGGGGGGGGGGGTPPVDTTPPAAPVVAPTNGTVITGTAEAGSSVRIDVNGDGSIEGTVTANGTGNWTFTPTTPLANGTTVRVTAADAAGNVSPPTTVTVDAAAPAVPAIGDVVDNVGAILGSVANGGSTDDTIPVLSGTGAEANARITVYDNGTAIGTTTANGAGAWSFTPSTALPAGTHSLTISATDAVGNASAQSAPYVITIDTTAPAVPTVGGVDDNVSPVVGNVANGGSTNDTIPVLSGTGVEANAVITIYDNGTAIGTANANGAGAWSFTPGAAFSAGAHSFTISATDAAGNASAQSAPYVITIDTTAPAVPTVGGVDDNVSPVVGNVANGGSTNDTIPVLSGTGAEANAVITIYDNGTAIGTASADGAGAWSFTPGAALSAGAHSFTISATDAVGNASPQSAAYVITIDTALPAVPTIGGVDDNVGAIVGNVANGGVTDDTIPVLSGTGAEANAVITVYDNGTAIGTANADGAGAWSFTPGAALPAGAHSFTISASDAAGNASAQSAPYAITIDTTLPAIPAIGGVDDNVSPVVGNVANGGSTNDTIPVLSGTGAEANAVITVYDNGTAIGTATADGAGAWSFTPGAALSAGAHSFTITASDAAGNASAQSAPYAITIDTTLPAIPVIGGVDDNVSPVVGNVANGGSTNDTIPVLSGTGAEANATITIYDNGTAIGTANADGAGVWSFTPTVALATGAHSFTISATDAAGNASAQSAPYAITIDTTLPAVPTIASIADNIGAITGPVLNNGFTDDTQPTLSGTDAEPNSVITIYDGGVAIGTAPADGAGAWSFTPTSGLATGPHSFTISATDAAGNASAQSVPHALTIDTSAPAIPTIADVDDNIGGVQGPVANGDATDDTSPTLSGVDAEANAVITIYDNGAVIGTTTADGTGAWDFTPAALGLGLHSFTVTASDAAGNTSPESVPHAITVNTAAPAAPVITSVTDDVGALIGPVANGGFTDDASPLLAGTGAQASGTVRVYDNGTLLGITTADGAGAWSFTPGAPLSEASHSFTVTTLDAVGNESLPSAAHVITVDLTAPTATIAITGLTDDTGTLGDWATDDLAPTFSGTLSAALGASDRVEISLDGGATWEKATVSGTSWFHGFGQIGLGAHNVDVRVVDTAGNLGNSASQAITITSGNVAPIAQATTADLLGLVGLQTLGLIDLNEQSLIAFDRNNNLQTVAVNYDAVLAIALLAPSPRLTYSAALAAELGLQVAVDHTSVLGLLFPQSELVITAVGGGAIDNLAVNELLKTVHFEANGAVIDLDLLGTVRITATDSNGASDSSLTGSLANASLLALGGDSTIKEGTSGDNILTGGATNDRLYGYDGVDILSGLDGNDLLRGGAGADQLDGGGGNDLLIYDAADTLIDGGTGTDVLLMADGTGLVATIDAATNIRNIEWIDLGRGDTGRSISIDEAGVLAATDSNRQLIVSGESNDGVTLTGAVYQGQTLINGHAYNQYGLGSTTVMVEDAVVTVVI